MLTRVNKARDYQWDNSNLTLLTIFTAGDVTKLLEELEIVTTIDTTMPGESDVAIVNTAQILQTKSSRE